MLAYQDNEEDLITFEKLFNFNDKAISEKVIIMAYYSFTTLSTVGFGDYYPISNGERLIMSGIMLLGIMCFSYIMGLFNEILNIFITINLPLEEDEKLN